jgi:uncharacterized protein YdaU (DUF1376 family)
VNYYEHHIGDWLKKCSQLSMAQEGCYRRLLDWYYANEKPLPIDQEDLEAVARVRSPEERRALDKVMKTYFIQMDDGWHQSRADKDLAHYQKKIPEKGCNREAQRVRSEIARERRSAMFRTLTESGITPAWNASTTVLLALIEANGLTLPPAPRHGTVTAPDHGTVTARPGTSVVARVTATQAPGTINTDTIKENPEARLLAVTAVRKAGLSELNASDPRFIALVADGATPEELALVAAEAAAKGKGWAWFLAVAKGRRDDAKNPQQGPKTARQRAAEAAVLAWVPELAVKP